jgi:hypothetical protein
MRALRTGAAAGALAVLVALSGCAGPTGPSGPPAWDKALLAKPEMAMSWNALASKYDQHIYESKEAASGGYGVGGGGCGCY